MTNENKPQEQPNETFEFDSYDLLSRNQQEAADLMLEAAYETDWNEYVHLAGVVERKYTGRTDSPKYLGEDGNYPVVDYVAERITQDYLTGIREGDSSGENALKQISIAFERFNNLSGMSSENECKARSFFQMRTFYREAVYIANQIGDTKAANEWPKRWARYNHNNYLEEELEDYDKDAQAREETYGQFQLEPDSEEIWESVIHQAEHEEARGETHRAMTNDVTVSDLAALAREIRDAPPEQRLSLIAGNAPNGEPWTNVLPGASQGAGFAMSVHRFQEVLTGNELLDEAVVLGAADTTFNDRISTTEPVQVKGGQIAPSGVSKRTIFVDSNQGTLNSSLERMHGRPVGYKLAEYTNLPFYSSSLELVIGNKATNGMDDREAIDFYMELSRVLKRGGSYLEQTGRENPTFTFNRWKLLLSQMIVDSTAPTVELEKRITSEQERAVVKGLGFEEGLYKYGGNTIRALTKKASIKSIGFHSIAGKGVDQKFAIELRKNKP